MPYRYPPEFRRRILHLLVAGRSVASLSADLGVSDQTIYNWQRQDTIDRGIEPGLTSAEGAQLRTARRRAAELETELAVTIVITSDYGLTTIGRPDRRSGLDDHEV